MWYLLNWNGMQVKNSFLITFAKYDLFLPSFSLLFLLPFFPKRKTASSWGAFFLSIGRG